MAHITEPIIVVPNNFFPSVSAPPLSRILLTCYYWSSKLSHHKGLNNSPQLGFELLVRAEVNLTVK